MELTYEQKLAIANKHINKRTMGSGLEWDDLADINSLHDVESEEDIIGLAEERLEDSGFPDEDENDYDFDEERATNLNEMP